MKKLFAGNSPAGEIFYRLCKKYIDRYHNENNDDMRTNGEDRFLRDRLPGCRTVFDVGANRGGWAKSALKVNPAIALHCFEPSHAAFQLLKANAFPANVKGNHFGLSSKEGEPNFSSSAPGPAPILFTAGRAWKPVGGSSHSKKANGSD